MHDEYPAVLIVATANENHYRDTAQIGSLGVPDLILFHLDGRVLFLELKRKKGKLLASQKSWNAWFDASGMPHKRAVAYGFAEAKAIIESFANP